MNREAVNNIDTKGTIHILRKHLNCRGGGEGGLENINFCLFSVIKHANVGGRVFKKPKNVLTLYMNA